VQDGAHEVVVRRDNGGGDAPQAVEPQSPGHAARVWPVMDGGGWNLMGKMQAALMASGGGG
jgi:hypothetical protein